MQTSRQSATPRARRAAKNAPKPSKGRRVRPNSPKPATRKRQTLPAVPEAISLTAAGLATVQALRAEGNPPQTKRISLELPFAEATVIEELIAERTPPPGSIPLALLRAALKERPEPDEQPVPTVAPEPPKPAPAQPPRPRYSQVEVVDFISAAADRAEQTYAVLFSLHESRGALAGLFPQHKRIFDAATFLAEQLAHDLRTASLRAEQGHPLPPMPCCGAD